MPKDENAVEEKAPENAFVKASKALEAWKAQHIHNSSISGDTQRVNRITQLLASIKTEIEDLV